MPFSPAEISPTDPAPDMLLVSMPFAHPRRPSLGLSLLATGLEKAKIRTELRYFHLDFVAMVGESTYSRLSGGEPRIEALLGEWVFARALFGDAAPNETYPRDLPNAPWAVKLFTERLDAALLAIVFAARARAEEFLEQCVEETLARRPRILGLTSTFLQHVASLALAKRIKERAPEIFVVMGGANCEGIMGGETLRCFPFLDAVVSGEADAVVVDLTRCVLRGDAPRGMPGVYLGEDLPRRFAEHSLQNNAFESAARVAHLDDLPVPNYDAFFNQWPGDGDTPPDIYFESARGCWWGEKSHCTFCGLNGGGMAFRSKSPERALEELDALVERYPGSAVYVVDNILDMRYFKNFIPALAERDHKLHLFYETKANLTKEHLRLLKRAGIESIQPGIESLCSEILRAMGKGVTALQNVQLLKWCEEVGVEPSWNLLWGFPDEKPESYARMARWIPRLTHLTPPIGQALVRVDRFSPLFDRADEFGLQGIRAFPSYGEIYPFPEERLRNLAYYFTHDDPRDIAAYTADLRSALAAWRGVEGSSALLTQDDGERLQVWDLRPDLGDRRLELRGTARRILLACDRIQSPARLARELGDDDANPAEIDDALARLVDDALLLEDEGLYLGLTIPIASQPPRPRVLPRFFELAIAPRLRSCLA